MFGNLFRLCSGTHFITEYIRQDQVGRLFFISDLPIYGFAADQLKSAFLFYDKRANTINCFGSGIEGAAIFHPSLEAVFGGSDGFANLPASEFVRRSDLTSGGNDSKSSQRSWHFAGCVGRKQTFGERFDLGAAFCFNTCL